MHFCYSHFTHKYVPDTGTYSILHQCQAKKRQSVFSVTYHLTTAIRCAILWPGLTRWSTIIDRRSFVRNSPVLSHASNPASSWLNWTTMLHLALPIALLLFSLFLARFRSLSYCSFCLSSRYSTFWIIFPGNVTTDRAGNCRCLHQHTYSLCFYSDAMLGREFVSN